MSLSRGPAAGRACARDCPPGAIRVFRAILLPVLAGIGALAAAAAPACAGPDIRVVSASGALASGTGADLLAAAERRGRIEVIVRVAVPALEAATGEAASRALIAAAQDGVLAAVPDAAGVHRFSTVPFVSMLATPGQLRALLGRPDVAAISQNMLLRPAGGASQAEAALRDINRIVGANKLHAKGKTGKLTVVALPDTGVDYTHPLLAGSRSKEACFSTNIPGEAESFCPNGKNVDKTAGSGKPCPVADFPDCARGTGLAGLLTASPASGKDVGVAPDARINPVQIFRKQLLSGDCFPDPAPCIRTNTADLAKALDWTAMQPNGGPLKIVAATIGLSGGNFSTYCDTPGDPVAAVFAKLRKKNISVIVAAGNNSLQNGIGYPGCLSGAIAVGGTDANDVPDPTGNWWPGPMVLAPDFAVPTAELVDLDTVNAVIAAGGVRALSGASEPRFRGAGYCTGPLVDKANSGHTRLSAPVLTLRAAKKPVKKLLRKFTTSADLKKVKARQGKCSIKNKRLSCTNPKSRPHIHAQIDVCVADKYDITVKFLHKDIDPLINFPAGLFVGGTTGSRHVSGNFFAVNKGAGGFGEIRQLRGFDLETGAGITGTLCQGPAPHDPKKINTLRAVGNARKATLFLNGTKVCETQDAFFLTGIVGLLAGKPSAVKGHSIEVVSIAMKNAIAGPIPQEAGSN